jgi:integrase-like protein
VNQEPQRAEAVTQVHGKVPGLLRRPRPGRACGHPGQVQPAGTVPSEHQHVQPLELRSGCPQPDAIALSPYYRRSQDPRAFGASRRASRQLPPKRRRSHLVSPLHPGIAERWIGGCRREILDRTLIWNRAQLRRILRQYETRHNRHRPHRSLDSAAPLKPLPEPVDLEQHRVRRRPRVGGMVNEYRLAA